LEKTLHPRAESTTNWGFKSFGWWLNFIVCYLVSREISIMPSKDCVKEVKVKSFAFYTGACAFAFGVLALLIILSKYS